MFPGNYFDMGEILKYIKLSGGNTPLFTENIGTKRYNTESIEDLQCLQR